MNFASRLTRCPIPFEPSRAEEPRARFAALAPELRGLLEGAAGCSPYLAGLMARQSDWIGDALQGSPEMALDAALGGFDNLGAEALGSALRLAKARVALLAGLADLGGVWTLEEVTDALTQLADAAVHQALVTLVGDEIRRGKLPASQPEDADVAGGMVALAM